MIAPTSTAPTTAITGVLLTGLVAAVGVQALLEAMRRHREP
jgi:hypothetical protein